MGSTGTSMTIAVPKSGCFITIKEGISTNPIGMIIEWNFFI